MGGDCLRKVITGGGSTVTNQLPSTEMANGYEIEGAFHLLKISIISGSAVNGTRFAGSSHWKFQPGKRDHLFRFSTFLKVLYFVFLLSNQ